MPRGQKGTIYGTLRSIYWQTADSILRARQTGICGYTALGHRGDTRHDKALSMCSSIPG